MRSRSTYRCRTTRRHGHSTDMDDGFDTLIESVLIFSQFFNWKLRNTIGHAMVPLGHSGHF
ncbi:hypothetical protein RHMOL_Rhmol12G0182400 [Rhododendron molle]|uniref:Uncharacterized protein n=1 Tax=Rhododendron molle TaxID=49168 RepID=A0ACC0LK23_RHOML|nr:hypothetical protein RHMOL_Rhmol12G0182400 [Rhododendron molle]